MLIYKNNDIDVLVEHVNVASSLDIISQDPSSTLISPSFIKQSLLLYKKQLTLFLEAITSFHQKKLIQFNAQVGDILCQIKAYKSNPYAYLLSEKRYKVAALSAIEGLGNEVSKLGMEIQALNALLKYFYIIMGHIYGCYRDNLNYLHVPRIFCLNVDEVLELS